MSLLANNPTELAEFKALCQRRLHVMMDHYLQAIPSLELKDAMRYSLSDGGKYIRPLLVYATGHIFNVPLDYLDIPATAVELIHTYSLIHDDLPCMDNADLRRGKPSCHKMYGEGLGVLTGDALHTLSVQILASHPAALSSEKRIQMLSVLCNACGPFGMEAGQALDIVMMDNTDLSLELLLQIYRLKTGALLSACVELGRLASTENEDSHQQALTQFGDCIGLAFQIQDDILDIESDTQVLGKTQGIDAMNQKSTYPTLVGLAAAKAKVQALYQEALDAIDYLGPRANLLRAVITQLLERKK